MLVVRLGHLVALSRLVSVACVQADLHIGAGLVHNRLQFAKCASQDRGGLQSFLQHDGALALVHEFATTDDEPSAGGPEAGIALARVVPTGEVTSRQDQ
jgi:hypothetical protein